MNTGCILGVVIKGDGSRAKNAIVRFDGLKIGGTKQDVFNPKSKGKTINLVRSDKDGKFKIYFLWESADIGHMLSQNNFKLFALDNASNAKGSGNGKIYLIPDKRQLTLSVLGGAEGAASGLLELKDFTQAASVMTAFQPRLSVIPMRAFGSCLIALS